MSYTRSNVLSTGEWYRPGRENLVGTTSSGPENGRTAMISVRLAPHEQDALRAEAAEQGESLSQFIRDVLLHRSESRRGVADVSEYPVSNTGVVSGLALESQDGHLVPRTAHPYVATTFSG